MAAARRTKCLWVVFPAHFVVVGSLIPVIIVARDVPARKALKIGS